MHRVTFILLAGAVIAQTPPPPAAPTGSISGVVRDAGTGTPIAEATIYVNRGSGGPQITADAQGRFTMRGLNAGRHRISAHAPSTGGPSAYDTRLVTLAPGQELESIDFALRTFGEISGRVVDQNNEPAPDVWVTLIAREYSLGVLRFVYAGLGETNDQGEYVLSRVAPGRAYLVMAAKKPRKIDAVSDSPLDPKLRRPAVVPTWYPGTPSYEGAQALVLRTGERRERVDIRLLRSPAFCIEGVLHGANGPEALSFQLADRRPHSGASGDGAMFLVPSRGDAGPDGKIRLCDLYPGEHQLTVFSRSNSGAPAFFGSTIIPITDSDVRNLSVALQPRVPVPGEVVWDGVPPQEPVSATLSVNLRPITRAPWQGEMTAAKAPIPGQFSFQGVLVDEYSVQIYGLPPDNYIKDVTYAGRSILYEPLGAGSATGEATMRIILARDGGTLAAKIADKDGKPVPNARVLVIPAAVQSEASLAAAMLIGQTDQNGAWTSARLAPGKYYVQTSTGPPDKSPESIGTLWRNRHQAKEVDIEPSRNVQITLQR